MAKPDEKPLVLVTGATGALGPRVVQALCDAGYPVRTLSIDQPVPGLFGEHVEVRQGDITDPQTVVDAVQGCEGIIHMAALLHVFNPEPVMRARYEKINIGGTAVVVDAASKSDVRRLVFFSTIAVYGPSRGEVLTEDSTPRPDTFYAETKLAAERVVLNAKNAGGRPIGCVLRFGAVYGARVKGNYRNLLKALAKGYFIPIGTGANRRTLIYDKDAARAAVLALEHPVAAGGVFNVSDGSYHTLSEIIEAMCHALGRNTPRLLIPVKPLRPIAGLIEDATHLAGFHSPITRALIDKYTEDMAVDCRRFQRQLGFLPAYSLSAGWKDAVHETGGMGE